MASSSIRFGEGSTMEVGMDLNNLKAKKVCVVTDPTVNKLWAMDRVRESLAKHKVNYTIFSDVVIEPKDYAVEKAIDYARKDSSIDAFLAVGGGSVIDTAKIMNLYKMYPEAELLDFVNAPIGKGRPVDKPLLPLIAIPTTAGTGSETTGTAIFDVSASKAKTGISHRNLRPMLGICDPLNTATMPSTVRASSGLDVLCHALESWTAVPYTQRAKPTNPLLRPAYQGANPFSDVFSLEALRRVAHYLPRSVHDTEDTEAQREMLFAAMLAGVGFGNAGVHLCHGMSYPIASQNPAGYRHAGYGGGEIIPHGVSVAVTAPSVFRFTAAGDPDRHLQAAQALGVDVSNYGRDSAGEVLADALAKFLENLGDQPRGLRGLGFSEADLPALVEGTVPQRRVLDLAPGLRSEVEGGRDQLAELFQASL